MGIFMDSIDFNECLKKKKELEKEARSTAPEEVKEEKVEEKKRKEISKVYSSMDEETAARLAVRGGMLQAVRP